MRPAGSVPEPDRDDRGTVRRQLLDGVIWLLLVASIVVESFQIVATVGATRIVLVGLLFLYTLGCRHVLRRGHLTVAAWMVIAVVFAVTTWSIWDSGRVDGPGATAYLILAAMAAMILGTRAAVVVSGLLFASLSGLAIAENEGWLAEIGPRRALFELWAIYSVQVLAAGWLAAHAAGLFDKVLSRLERRNRELATSHARYASLLEQLPDVIVVIGPDGVVLECSASVERVFGYLPEQVIGRSFFDIGAIPDLDDALRESILDQIMAEEFPPLPSARLRHRDGSFRWVEASGRMVESEEGAPRLHIVVRDATERLEAEEAQASLHEQLEEARRLEALGRLAGGVAHDFNNLLLVISANTEILRRGTGDADAALDQLRDAQKGAAELIRQLLAFSGQAPQATEVIDVAETVERVEGLLRRLVPPGVDFTVTVPDEPTPTRFGAAQLEQVVMNLVMNAIQALGDSGRIDLDVSRPDPASIRISVIDDGPGMTRATLERIFDPFYTERPGGTGLGLASTRGNVVQGGGHITVASNPGEGARFDVYLPAAASDTPGAPAPPHLAPAELTGMHILLVDDEPAVRETLVRGLEDLGAVVVAAGDSEAAIETAAREDSAIDLLVTDVRMPGMNGADLAQRLRADRPGLPVLFISGYAAELVGPEDTAAADTAFLAKPFGLDALAAAIAGLATTGSSTRSPQP